MISHSFRYLTESFLSDLSVIPHPDRDFPIWALSHSSPWQRVPIWSLSHSSSLTESFLSDLSVIPLPDSKFPIWSFSLSSLWHRVIYLIYNSSLSQTESLLNPPCPWQYCLSEWQRFLTVSLRNSLTGLVCTVSGSGPVSSSCDISFSARDGGSWRPCNETDIII